MYFDENIPLTSLDIEKNAIDHHNIEKCERPEWLRDTIEQQLDKELKLYFAFEKCLLDIHNRPFRGQKYSFNKQEKQDEEEQQENQTGIKHNRYETKEYIKHYNLTMQSSKLLRTLREGLVQKLKNIYQRIKNNEIKKKFEGVLFSSDKYLYHLFIKSINKANSSSKINAVTDNYDDTLKDILTFLERPDNNADQGLFQDIASNLASVKPNMLHMPLIPVQNNDILIKQQLFNNMQGSPMEDNDILKEALQPGSQMYNQVHKNIAIAQRNYSTKQKQVIEKKDKQLDQQMQQTNDNNIIQNLQTQKQQLLDWKQNINDFQSQSPVNLISMQYMNNHFMMNGWNNMNFTNQPIQNTNGPNLNTQNGAVNHNSNPLDYYSC